MAQLVVDHFLECCSTGFWWSVDNLFRIKIMLHHFKLLFLYTGLPELFVDAKSHIKVAEHSFRAVSSVV